MTLLSRNVVEGPSRAPHRAMFKAMGLKDQDLEKPLVGVSSTCNEATPCNLHLGKLAQSQRRSEGFWLHTQGIYVYRRL